ncbi:hypothetical protein ACTXT7_017258 [Hymenolepis weldensis]
MVRDELIRVEQMGVLQPVTYLKWPAPAVVLRKATRICADFSTGLNSRSWMVESSLRKCNIYCPVMNKDIEYLVRLCLKCQQAAKNPIRQDDVLWPQTDMQLRGPGCMSILRITREIPGRGVDGSKVENGAQSDAEEENLAEQGEGE